MIPTQLFTPTTASFTFTGSQGISRLAEFASSMVYLMWHGRKASKASERSWGGNDFSLWQSGKNTCPTLAFKNFCYHVLTATCLQESAVYLCLKYVSMLLQLNPNMEGSEGSEYRLFVVALMLANKFLDDNTFSNKTWSEVSGMKLRDLNLMEAEFMEALDYSLFVRSQEYNIWKNLIDGCRDRLSHYNNTNPHQRQQLVVSILHTIGLERMQLPMFSGNYIDNYYGDPYAQDWDIAAARLQYENSYNRYQHFMQSKSVIQPPPVGYPITNLSQSSWDPLAYSLNQSFYSTQTPISWSNF